jgi:regulator of sigma E protease
MNYLIPFLILITIVVFIHEYGHYYFARKYGVGITDFSIGFGREIFGWNDKSGTRWKICWIPLGGYVKFFGDRNVFSQSEQQELIDQYNDEDKKKLFILKPLYQRAIIVAAGPLANFLLAILIFTMINLFIGKIRNSKNKKNIFKLPAFQSTSSGVNRIFSKINVIWR